MSLFVVIMRGPYDALLTWPVRRKITLKLLSQDGSNESLMDAFGTDPNSSSYKKPVAEMNVASGCPKFAKLEDLASYVKEDTMFIRIMVESQ